MEKSAKSIFIRRNWYTSNLGQKTLRTPILKLFTNEQKVQRVVDNLNLTAKRVFGHKRQYFYDYFVTI